MMYNATKVRNINDRKFEVHTFIIKFCCKITINVFFFHSKISRYKTMTQERKLLYLVLWGYMDLT